MATQRQIESNRRNALKSTGPRTAAGKTRTSRNALRHGLTAKTLYLDDEQQADLAQLRDGLIERFDVVGERQEQILDAMLPIAWKLSRAAEAEAQATIEFDREHGGAKVADLLQLDFDQLAVARRTRGVGISRALLLSALQPPQAISGIPMVTFGRYAHGLEERFFKLLLQLGQVQRQERAAAKFLTRSKPKSDATGSPTSPAA